MSKILILDNYDSFVYNLLHYTEDITQKKVDIFKNDDIQLDKIEKYSTIILSPGPGIPSEAGILLPLIRRYAPTKRIFGVCLGLQAIAEAFGAKLVNPPIVFHGIESRIKVTDTDDTTFNNLPDQLQVGRYHSWLVSKSHFPEALKVTATDEQGDIMALRHRIYDVRAVQFHPESIMTPYGRQMLESVIKA
ncbi:MAG: anthranilate synthase component II [Saprospiraceae bacterium]